MHILLLTYKLLTEHCCCQVSTWTFNLSGILPKTASFANVLLRNKYTLNFAVLLRML